MSNANLTERIILQRRILPTVSLIPRGSLLEHVEDYFNRNIITLLNCLSSDNVTPSNTCFLQPTQLSIPKCTVISSAVFAQLTADTIPIPYNEHPNLPSKWPLCTGESGTPSNIWFHGPTHIHNPNGTSIGSAVFAEIVTDRQTNRQTTLQCGLKCIQKTAKKVLSDTNTDEMKKTYFKVFH